MNSQYMTYYKRYFMTCNMLSLFYYVVVAKYDIFLSQGEEKAAHLEHCNMAHTFMDVRFLCKVIVETSNAPARHTGPYQPHLLTI